MTLYELTGEYRMLLALAEDPDMDPQTITDTMEAIEGDIEDKAENYAKVMRTLSADVDGIKAEISRLSDRKKAIENNITRMKAALEEAMRATGKTKFKTALFSFGIQKNPPRCVIDNTEAIPEQFLIAQEPKVDTAGILKAMKAGTEFDFAHMEQGESLRIR